MSAGPPREQIPMRPQARQRDMIAMRPLPTQPGDTIAQPVQPVRNRISMLPLPRGVIPVPQTSESLATTNMRTGDIVISKNHRPASKEQPSDVVAIPKKCSVDGYAGQYFQTDFSFGKLTHQRQPDRSYAMLDLAPVFTDVLISLSDDALWIHVNNPEEPDNDRRTYAVASAKENKGASASDELVAHPLTPAEIDGIAARIGEQLAFEPNPKTGDQVSTLSRVEEVMAFSTDKPLHPDLVGSPLWPEVSATEAFLSRASN